MNRHNLEDWLISEVGEEIPGMQAPQTQPGPPPGMPPGDPNITAPNQQMAPEEPQNQAGGQPGETPDISNDPQVPDMPQEREEMDFEQWKNKFLKESIKGDVQKMTDMVQQVRDMELDPYPRKFVEDNLQILFLRQNANIDKAGKEIRKLLRDELDQNNPSASVVNHIFNTLQSMPELSNVFIKMNGLLGSKADLHRKYIAALIGGVQVGAGGDNEDVVFNENEYAIRISTRFNYRWGKVDLGRWSLKEDDPERYLSEPEQQRLEEGSPEEKEALRHRVVMESVANQFKQRAFVINVVNNDGTVYTFGWDISSAVRQAYTEGKLKVKLLQPDGSEAMITDEGNIVPYTEIKIMYMKDTGEVDEEGRPRSEEHEFMSREEGLLFLTGQFQTIQEVANSFQGMSLKEMPYNGNPSDLKALMRCVPNATEMLMRQC